MLSRTSIWAAAARAFGAREPDEHVRNPDWLAERFLGPDERALLGDHPLSSALDQPFELAAKNMEAMGAARILIPRTHFIDSRLEAAIREGATQIVILGAGFDSRVYRFAELLQGAQAYEVDQPEMQELKVRRVRQTLGEPPANATYVPVDFRCNALGVALIHAGYRPDRRTFFIWEGVTMYLPAESVRDTLRWVAGNAAPGSSIVFDYTYETSISSMRKMAAIDIEKLPEAARQAAMRYRRLLEDEPWIFGLPDREETEFLNDFRLDLRKVLGINSAEAVTNYLTRADGSIFAFFPATEVQGYLILEAVVP